MQRVWRSKPSKELVMLMEESVDIKLYLIQEKGPLSFVLQDEVSKKYTVSISEKVSCSCSETKTEHCIHTIYVLNRIFKIDFNNSLIFQLNFTDAELSKMAQDRKGNNKKSGSSNNTNFTNNGKINLNENLSNSCYKSQNIRMNLYDDVTCSICQEDMYTVEGLFYCGNSCGHNFHFNCLKIWGEHKKSVSDKISCPMCRAIWDEADLKISLTKNSSLSDKVDLSMLKRHKGINCKKCSRINIRCERFRCLTCDSFDICVECYKLGLHELNHNFIVKKNADGKWSGLKVSDSSFILLNMKLSQYFVSILKDDKKNNNDTLIENNDDYNKISKQCIVCKSDRTSSLQLLKFIILPCDHLVHFKCAESLFKIFSVAKGINVDDNFNICKTDSLQIFPGLKGIIIRTNKNENENDQASNINLEIDKEYKNKNLFFLKSDTKNKSSVNTKNKSLTYPIKNNLLPSLKNRFLNSNISTIKKDDTIELTLNIEKIIFNPYPISENIFKKNKFSNKLKKIPSISSIQPKRKTFTKLNEFTTNTYEEDMIRNKIDGFEYEEKLTRLKFNNNLGLKIVNLNPTLIKVT